MSAIEKRLDQLIAASGVRLVETSRLTADLNACYHADNDVILVKWGLDPVTRRCAIAHELGHAHAGDTCSSARAERTADEWAALHLLDLDAVEQAAYDVDEAPAAMADKLKAFLAQDSAS